MKLLKLRKSFIYGPETAAKHIYQLLTSVKILPEPHGFLRKLRHLSRLFKKK